MTDRMKQILLALAAGVIFVGVSACTPSIKRDAPEVVELPVPVMPEPHEELKQCGKEEPGFQFHEHEEKEDHVVLPPDEQKQLQEWVDGKERCLDGWREWSSG